jgi:hypothetical protein
MMLDDAGLTGLFLSEATALIAMAEVIGGKEAQIALLQARFNATATAMNAHLWNDTRGFYNNVLWDGTPSVHLSPTSSDPLMAGPASGAVPKERAQAMVATLVSPLGMCLNASAYGPGGAFSTPLSRWAKTVGEGGGEDTATCASQACIADLVIHQYPLTPVASLGAVVLNASASGAGGGQQQLPAASVALARALARIPGVGPAAAIAVASEHGSFGALMRFVEGGGGGAGSGVGGRGGPAASAGPAALLAELRRDPDGSGRPRAIVCHTVKGKGVSFMEDDNNWHYRIPTAEEVTRARAELRQP